MCVEGEEEAMEGKKCARGGLDGDGFVCVCMRACRQTGERESECVCVCMCVCVCVCVCRDGVDCGGKEVYLNLCKFCHPAYLTYMQSTP